MSDRPILFSAPMVRTLLDDRKTQTRRIIKPQPSSVKALDAGGAPVPFKLVAAPPEMPTARCEAPIACPYGKPGDHLWVKERMVRAGKTGWVYFADRAGVTLPQGDPRVPAMIAWAHHKEGGNCVSIHMPRWASRLTLKITDVRVERLNDISEADAMAEGLHTWDGEDQDGEPPFAYPLWNWREPESPDDGFERAADAYESLWEEINGPGSWALNSWVWAVSFERTAQP